MPVILATQEAEISQPGQIVHQDLTLKIYKKGLEE
jgi:hypothetical protein